jgi:hypothetical protein
LAELVNTDASFFNRYLINIRSKNLDGWFDEVKGREIGMDLLGGWW